MLEGCAIADIPHQIYTLLKEYLGIEGSIVAPSFNFGFGAGVPFERLHTPALAMGVFAEYIRRLPISIRSSHPMESVCAVGSLASKICTAQSGSSFTPGGPFDIMLKENAVLLFIGASTGRASLAHYCEEKFQVPYRFWKHYSGLYDDGELVCTRTFPMYVRNIKEYPSGLDFTVIEDWLLGKKMLRRAGLGGGFVKACNFDHYVQVAMEKLSQDPLCLLKTTGGGWPEKYSGTRKDGLPYGRGTLLFPDGTKYSGDYLNGKRHGNGIMTGPNGEKYTGDWKDGLRHGTGTIVVPHEYVYRGQWEKGFKQGYGILTWSDCGAYTGQWSRGKMHGQGTLKLCSGWSYRGEFRYGSIQENGAPKDAPT